MSLLIPGEAKFSMGVSSTTVSSSSGQEKIDMSLDDLIKSRRDESKKAPRRSTRRRTDPKKPTTSLRNAAQNTNRRAEGSRRAKKSAATNFRRGMRDTKAPTKMEVEKEIKKQNGTVKFKKGALKSKRPIKPRPPTRKAIKAAVSAMSSAGFKVPDGMRVVINLEKESKPLNNTKKNMGMGKGTKKPTNNEHPNKSNGGRLWGKKK